MTQAAAKEMIDTSAQLGWQLGIHAIGDAAIEQVVQFYDGALQQHPAKDHRWFLAHFTMLPSVETLDLMANTASCRGATQLSFYNLEGRYVDTLDGARLEHINPVGTALAHHVVIAFSSDNLPIGPMVGIYAATTRKGPSGRVFGIEEAISREQAITMYTRNGAYFTWEENHKGTLEPGKFADMIVLDRDPLTVREDELLAARVDLTVIGGKIVYRRAESAQ
jgi:predicted amidohydrolase YtcJ